MWLRNWVQKQAFRYLATKRSSFRLDNSIVQQLFGDFIDTDVSPQKGYRVTAVFNSINTIAREIASTPIDRKVRTDKGKVSINSSPEYRAVAKRPNKKMSSYSWLYSMVTMYLGWGNAYSYIYRVKGEVFLIPLMPWDVSVTETADDLFYKYQGFDIPSRDIIHFKLYTKDGKVGISPISYNAEMLGHRIKQTTYAKNAIGTKPNGFLSSDATTDEQFTGVIENWMDAIEKGKPPFLSAPNMKWNNIMIPPNEGQMIETMKYTDQMIYAMYNLPPTFAGDYSQGVKANAEQQALTLVKHCLMPHFVMIEQELDEKLSLESEKYSDNPPYWKFNVYGKLRGDTAAQKDFIHTMINDGVFNADTVLDLYDMPHQPDGLGQEYIMQGALVSKKTLTQPIIQDE